MRWREKRVCGKRSRIGNTQEPLEKVMRPVDESGGKMKGGTKMAKKKTGVFWKPRRKGKRELNV